MSWNTIHDYINDPAGFDAHHRRWKAENKRTMTDPTAHDINGSLEWVRRSYLLDLVRRADVAEARASQLEAVADAARAMQRATGYGEYKQAEAKLNATLGELYTLK